MCSDCGPQPASASGAALSRGATGGGRCAGRIIRGDRPRLNVGQLPPSKQKMGRTGECAPPSRRLLEITDPSGSLSCPTSTI